MTLVSVIHMHLLYNINRFFFFQIYQFIIFFQYIYFLFHSERKEKADEIRRNVLEAIKVLQISYPYFEVIITIIQFVYRKRNQPFCGFKCNLILVFWFPIIDISFSLETVILIYLCGYKYILCDS